MVGVIDIGSNSIKILVAARGADGRVVAKKLRTIEARISAGISADKPRLAPEGIERGLAAVTELAADAQAFQPEKIIVVATSAVRDAENGADFCARIKAAVGLEVRVLSGEAEAELIGRGLLCDPQLAGEREFYVFDLGGGSLECLAFRDRRVAQAASLPLGCVRLTEKFVADPAAPFRPETSAVIAAHVRAIVTAANFSLAGHAVAVGTGGTLTAVRSVLAARANKVVEEVPAEIPVRSLREMLEQVGSLALPERRKVPGLPPGRADVFPAAMATLIAVADLGGFAAYRHSLYNLRWGLAAEALSSAP